VLEDLRFAARTLFRSPLFLGLAGGALALGIGATTSIFSAVQSLLLHPLPFPEPERLVMVGETNAHRGYTLNEVAAGNFLDWRKESRSFESLAAWAWWDASLSGDGPPERTQGFLVSHDFFGRMLRVRPALGRDFLPEEEREGRHRVVLLSHGLHVRRFGGDPAIVGRDLRINGRPFTVIGVMPRGAGFPAPADLWAPLWFTAAEAIDRDAHYLLVAGRLKPGVAREGALADLGTLAARLEREHPSSNAGWGVNVVPLAEDLVAGTRPPLILLSGAVALVLLIACANVANLLLARGVARGREIAVRAALGAGRARLLRQLLTESLLLALLGGGLGLLVALWGIELIRGLVPPDVARHLTGWNAMGLDVRVLGFAAAVSFAAALLFGALPSWQASRADPGQALRDSAQTVTGGRGGRRLGSALIVGEVALAITLLAGAGLMLRSVVRLLAVDPGFDPRGLTAARVALPAARYGEGKDQAAFYARLLDRLRAAPGVEAAALASHLPLGGMNAATDFAIEGRPEPPPGRELNTNIRSVSPGYFETLRIPVLRGRALQERDTEGAPAVVVVNAALAAAFWPEGGAVGARVRVEGRSAEVVGITGDLRHDGLDRPPEPEMYLSALQVPFHSMAVVVRSRQAPEGAAASIRHAVNELDPELPVHSASPMEEFLRTSILARRITMLLLGAFAILALGLSAVGLYGVISYSVSRRTGEIGLRMALGARRGEIARMVLVSGMKLVLAGVAVGFAGALALGRLMTGLLFAVGPADPPTYAGIAIVLAAVGVLACWLPARRASAIDPMTALRCE
jgi:putative ABC transport system permease protein